MEGRGQERRRKLLAPTPGEPIMGKCLAKIWNREQCSLNPKPGTGFCGNHCKQEKRKYGEFSFKPSDVPQPALPAASSTDAPLAVVPAANAGEEEFRALPPLMQAIVANRAKAGARPSPLMLGSKAYAKAVSGRRLVKWAQLRPKGAGSSGRKGARSQRKEEEKPQEEVEDVEGVHEEKVMEEEAKERTPRVDMVQYQGPKMKKKKDRVLQKKRKLVEEEVEEEETKEDGEGEGGALREAGQVEEEGGEQKGSRSAYLSAWKKRRQLEEHEKKIHQLALSMWQNLKPFATRPASLKDVKLQQQSALLRASLFALHAVHQKKGKGWKAQYGKEAFEFLVSQLELCKVREEVEGRRLALEAHYLGARLPGPSGGGGGGEKEEQKLFRERWRGIVKDQVALVMHTIAGMVEGVEALIKDFEEDVQAASGHD